jgi:hypothetical protein
MDDESALAILKYADCTREYFSKIREKLDIYGDSTRLTRLQILRELFNVENEFQAKIDAANRKQVVTPAMSASASLDGFIQMQKEIIAKQRRLAEEGPNEDPNILDPNRLIGLSQLHGVELRIKELQLQRNKLRSDINQIRRKLLGHKARKG